MEKKNGQYHLYGNPLSKADSRKCDKWQNKFIKMFNYNENETYNLSAEENNYLGDMLGIKNIVRDGKGEPIDPKKGVVVSTIRMGYGHYRIAMAGASCAQHMGYTPYWLDLLAIPGITTDVINYCNTWYSKCSRISQKSKFFNKYIWEPVTTGDKTSPLISWILNNWIVAWPWRFLKTNIKDYKMSELFKGLYGTLPKDMPILTAHMWNCMGAVAGGMTNVVDMMFDNWPMAFQLVEGAKHAVQSPSGYYGFRTMNAFDENDDIMKPIPEEAIEFAGHLVDHELVENIEQDCADRIRRMKNREPRRVVITMGGAGAQRELFKAIIDHCIPLIKSGEICLFVNLGDHKGNWEWLEQETIAYKDMLNTHFDWEDTKAFTDKIRTERAEGLHVFLHDNTFHGVYATNYFMRVIDVMITKPSELAFYPVPKIFNERVGGHEKWGAIRGAELGDGTVEVGTIPQTLQAVDMLVKSDDVLEMFCDCIVKNKQIGIYDGGYKAVAMATGTTWERGASKELWSDYKKGL